jgi:hypothetical protein
VCICIKCFFCSVKNQNTIQQQYMTSWNSTWKGRRWTEVTAENGVQKNSELISTEKSNEMTMVNDVAGRWTVILCERKKRERRLHISFLFSFLFPFKSGPLNYLMPHVRDVGKIDRRKRR